MATINLRDVDPDWYLKVKIAAARERITIKQFIIQAATQALKKSKDRERTHNATV